MNSANNTASYKRSVLMVILAGVFLSTLGIGTRLLEGSGGLQLVFYRSVGVLPALLLVIWLRRGSTSFLDLLHIGKLGLLASLCLVGTSIFVVLALTYTSVANAMFIISLAPLVAGMFGWAILGEKLSRITMIAILASLLGVAIIIQGALSTDGWRGIFYAFGMLFCYGLFSVCLRLGKDIDMLPCIALHALILILCLGLWLPSLIISTSDLIICLALGVFQLGAGLTLITLASPNVPAAQLVLLAMLEVVLSPIWVWIGVGEQPSANALIGGVIIMAAIAFQALAPQSDSPAKANL